MLLKVIQQGLKNLDNKLTDAIRHRVSCVKKQISSSHLGNVLPYSRPLNASSVLKAPDAVHHGAPRFIIDHKALCHYCTVSAPIDRLLGPVHSLDMWKAFPVPLCYYSCCHICGKLCRNDCAIAGSGLAICPWGPNWIRQRSFHVLCYLCSESPS